MKLAIKFTLRKLNTEKYINTLINKYDIFDIKTNEDKISFCVNIKNKKNIKQFFKSRKIEILNISSVGFFSSLFNLSRLGIFVAIFVCCIAWLVSSFFVTDILIYGANQQNVIAIKKIVSEMFSSNIISKSNINTAEIEQKIISTTKINTVSCVIKGATLIVNVKEELNTSQYLEGDFSPLISLYDGQITSINVIQGTAVVEVGDIIKLGDVLVEPYIIDASGNKKQVQPIADIVCDVWITAETVVYDEQEVTEKTGNITKNREIYVFGKQIFSQNKQNPYTSSITSQTSNFISNFLLPIKAVTTTYEETTKILKKIDFEKNKQQYIDKCRQIALLNVREYDIIKDEKQTIIEDNGKHTITYVITISKKVC